MRVLVGAQVAGGQRSLRLVVEALRLAPPAPATSLDGRPAASPVGRRRSSGGGGRTSPSSCAALVTVSAKATRSWPTMITRTNSRERRARRLQEDRLHVEQPVLADGQHQQVAADHRRAGPIPER